MMQPPFPPDLNSIESDGNRMKDNVSFNFVEPGSGLRKADLRHREIVEVACDSISKQQPLTLIESMLDRCETVV